MRRLLFTFVVLLAVIGVGCRSGNGGDQTPTGVGSAAAQKADSPFRNLGKRAESE